MNPRVTEGDRNNDSDNSERPASQLVRPTTRPCSQTTPSAVTSERENAILCAAIGCQRAFHTPWGAVLEGDEVDSASGAPPAHLATRVIAEQRWGLDVAVVSDGFVAGPRGKGAVCSCCKEGIAMLSSCMAEARSDYEGVSGHHRAIATVCGPIRCRRGVF